MVFLNILTFIFFCNLNNPSSGFDGQQLVRELGTELCPYTNFCTLNASKVNYDMSYIPCCHPCFCDNDCWELDNCCPDKEVTLQPSDLVPCKNTEVKSARVHKRDTTIYGSGYFRVIDTCPWTEGNVTLIELCSGYTQTSLGDYTWVSDYSNGKIYQNVHCAKCHKVVKYVSWQVQTTCNNILKADFDNLEETLLSDSCDIINVLPDIPEAMMGKYECYEPKPYTECIERPHAQLRNLSQEVVAACKHTTWAYGNGDVDKNVFCFVCKHGLNANRNELCERDLGSRGGEGNDREKFSVIISYHGQSINPDDKNRDLGCHRNEVIDKYMGRCHKLLCPFGRAPLFGRCEPILSNIGSLCVYMHFYLEILWPLTKLESLNDESIIGMNVLQQFLQYVGWEKAGCSVMRSYIKDTNGTTPRAGYLVWYMLRSNSSCQPDFIQQQASKVLDKTIAVNITGDVIVVLIHPSKRYEKDLTRMRLIYNIFGIIVKPLCSLILGLNEEKFCPKIELKTSYVEMFSAMQEKEKITFLSFFENVNVQNDTDTIYMCAEEYLTFMSLVNAGQFLKVVVTNFFACFIVIGLAFS